MKYCTKCGFQVNDEDKFCARCGAPLTDVNNPLPNNNQNPLPNQEVKPNNTKAILSLVFGCLSTLFLGLSLFASLLFGILTFGFAIPALVLGIKSRKNGCGLAGMITSIVVLAIGGIVLIIWLMIFSAVIGSFFLL